MTRQETVAAARAGIAQKRRRAETRAAELRARLYAAVPRLAELARAQSDAGVAAARLAADGLMAEAGEKLRELRACAELQKQLLRELGENEDALRPRYECPVCGDTGRRGGEPCECLLREVKRLRRGDINGGALAPCRFENFSLDKYPEKLEGAPVSPRAQMTAILRDCRGWAADFGLRSRSLYMFGDAGLGKTHLALSVAAEVLNAGFDVIYISAQSAFAAIAAERGADGRTLAGMLEADLLVLDDLGTEYLDAYTRSRLYELVNGRMHRRPTIYTSNICRQELLNHRYDEKIASRLLGDCHLMRFWGTDIRLAR